MNHAISGKPCAAAVVAIACLAAAPIAYGAAATWNGSVSNLWTNTSNWTGGPPVNPETTSVVYTFGAATSANPASVMNASWTTGRIAFSVSGYSINQPNGGSNTLSLAGTANAQVVSNAASVTGSAINVPINFVTGLTGGAPTLSRLIDVSASGALALNGAINTNGGSVIKTGAGTLTLGAANTFASGTSFGFNTAGSTVRLGNNGALGNATIVHNTGFTVSANTNVTSSGDANVKLAAADVANPITLTNNVSLGGTGSFGLTESAAVFNGTSVMNLAGTVTIDQTTSSTTQKIIGVETNTVATISGPIVNGTGNGGIDKGNPGVLVLTNASNTFSGGVRLNVGTVRVGSDAALGSGTFTANSSTAVTVLAATNAGPRTLANNATLGGVNTLQYGDTGFTNNLTFNGTTSLASLNADATAGTTDDLKPLSITGGTQVVTLNGNISEVNAGSGISKLGAGTLVLAGSNTFTGGITVNAGTVHVTGTNASNASVGAGKISGTSTGSVRVLSVFDGTADSTANGGTLSPGTDTTAGTFNAGRADFADGGNYLFNLTNAAGAAGTGWDLLNLTGTGTANGNLNVTAGAGGFTLKIATLDPAFDATQNQVFRFVQALGVLNFAVNDILVDTSAVSVSGGAFTVAQNGNNFDLVYSAAPEPGTWLSVSIGTSAVVMTRRRRAATAC